MTTQALICILIGVLFAIVFPLGLILWWNRKYRGNIWPFFAGMICFTLFAMGLEQIFHYFLLMPGSAAAAAITGSPVLYTLYASLAAGIFEETGRLFGFQLLLKKRRSNSVAIGYGIGHGGVEVLFVFGLTYTMYLLAGLGISFGNEATDTAVQSSMGMLSVGTALLAMVERVSAMMIHVGLSMVMFTAVRQKGKLWRYPMAIGIHALADVSAALYQFGIIRALWMVEVCAFIMGVATLTLGAVLLCRKPDEASCAVRE